MLGEMKTATWSMQMGHSASSDSRVMRSLISRRLSRRLCTCAASPSQSMVTLNVVPQINSRFFSALGRGARRQCVEGDSWGRGEENNLMCLELDGSRVLRLAMRSLVQPFFFDFHHLRQKIGDRGGHAGALAPISRAPIPRPSLLCCRLRLRWLSITLKITTIPRFFVHRRARRSSEDNLALAARGWTCREKRAATPSPAATLVSATRSPTAPRPADLDAEALRAGGQVSSSRSWLDRGSRPGADP